MEEQRSRITDPLLGKMWKTKSSRFNAHTRLTHKHSLSTWATTILAFYIFVASVIPLVYPEFGAGGAERFILVVTVIISVFLIIITLLEASKNYQGEGERMLRCAIEISEIYNRFQALSVDRADSERTIYAEQYSGILQKHELNHKDIDFLQFQLRNSDELALDMRGYLFGMARYCLLWFVEYWLYIVLVLAPPIVVLVFRRQF